MAREDLCTTRTKTRIPRAMREVPRRYRRVQDECGRFGRKNADGSSASVASWDLRATLEGLQTIPRDLGRARDTSIACGVLILNFEDPEGSALEAFERSFCCQVSILIGLALLLTRSLFSTTLNPGRVLFAGRSSSMRIL